MALDFTIAPYQTGDLVDGMATYRFSFPDQVWVLQAIMGALETLTNPDNWNTVGEQTPQDAASLMVAAVEGFQPMNLAGTIMPFAGSALPDGALWCNGQSLLRTSYPDLFASIGTTFGAVDSTHFSLPDLRGRAAIGAGQGSGLSNRALGAQVGAEAHTLSATEMPVHTHSEIAAVATLINGGLEAPASSAVVSASVTGSAGSGGAHNNMQPSLVLNYIIWTR